MTSKNKNPDFSKIVCFTDIHLGLKNNSREHNDECEKFIKWMIEQANAQNIKTCVFLGDWHHVRSAINISTLNYSVNGLKLLNDYFDHTYFIIGNHDLFYRDKYELHSLPYIHQFSNIIPVDKIIKIDEVALVPWLVSDEWKKISKIQEPYMFGHFELPTFKMNAMVEMPDHGSINRDHFINQRQVFSGHFHKRQNKGKIWYVGNCFPHNYSDTWDDDRGIMIWSKGQTPDFLAWPDAPKFRTLTLSQVLTNPAEFIDSKTFAKITIDVPATYEDINFIREMLEKELSAREVQMITAKDQEIEFNSNAEVSFESVDSIVISHLETIDSNTIDKNELIKIYQEI
jgi:DNA repair exonuclease SbcCD nuclease subunit